MIKWSKGSLASVKGNVIGDELLGESLASAVSDSIPGCKAELYARNYRPSEKLDVMVYLNEMPPEQSLARKHVVYVQNGGFDVDAETLLSAVYKLGFDDHVFFSRKLLEVHQKRGHSGLFLPFGVDLDLFYPRPASQKYAHDVAYVGNDIKGDAVTMKYLFPATGFDFGLYGNWKRSLRAKMRLFPRPAPYKNHFEQISRGKIPQEDIPVLYSSSSINLNCTLQDCVDWDVITLRTLEVLACRGFLITDVVPCARDILSECVVFTGGDEQLREQISYYLANAAERKRFADNGFEYVREHGSIAARAKELVAYLG